MSFCSCCFLCRWLGSHRHQDLWANRPCSLQLGYWCRKPCTADVVSVPPPVIPVQESTIDGFFGQEQLVLYERESTFDEAQLICKDNAMTLARISNEREYIFLLALKSEARLRTDAWIGMLIATILFLMLHECSPHPHSRCCLLAGL